MLFQHAGLIAIDAIPLDRTLTELLDQLPIYICVDGDGGEIVVF